MAAQIPQGKPQPLQHPLIGSLQGRYGKGAIQYLGVQYASLENRLAEPQVMEYPKRLNLDTRKHGPPVITPAGAADMEMSFIQQHLPKPELPPMSDTKGLNLNITVPIDGGENLPVMVYIHGGGFAFGSSAYPHYDQTKVVELSGIMDQRVVAVNLNYRLGIPGFLTSEELRWAGFKANRGLMDQKAALQWVKRYISGFGGDPQRVTVIGQSAGAGKQDTTIHNGNFPLI
ncbi:unnamed protein product [Clonostachys byssicola]|uniref:Carboxylic ester hydrolase n=1 Tax=Clonostachys byssicola TaxID=160290 RepID=A0A9N9U021_9HYPO|nr:unnamed protein product [Clonostachys byssicola]